jgi:hypothetical protein
MILGVVTLLSIGFVVLGLLGLPPFLLILEELIRSAN